ncbi:potassium-transporting ATPase subunit F [Mycobacterium intracellulare]|nr:potassium-transporting ATPase subunit F [Mycobacterium intracellulare]MCA2251966.1 potassium-transporting ATPase subunit F [Mycobacterium intracellulare]MCA2276211.1 potassium-transporting ATPase subunit F [Mycobacterium intracellulare]MCA2328550.1 potassium-transporting ATPase subunit F [Mycobacterium intracellulare]UQB86442.1 potassium-transporting ATPase subunit F [Mycobacterium intracellulare]
MRVIGAERRRDGRGGVRRADRGGVRRTRRGSEAGRAAMNYQNTVGLVLSVLVALYVGSALLFPERF